MGIGWESEQLQSQAYVFYLLPNAGLTMNAEGGQHHTLALFEDLLLHTTVAPSTAHVHAASVTRVV